MPEGDSIHRLARRLAVLVGQSTTRLWVRDRGDVTRLLGAPIIAVEAVGKHLLVGIGEHHVLHTHLGMPGRVRRASGAAAITWDTSAIVGCASTTFVWHSARTAALVRRDDPGFVRAMQAIGPDLLAPDCDLDDVVARALASGPDRFIADLLLDQSVAAGLGNVFKSEIMFAFGWDPQRKLGSVDPASVRDAYALGRAMLQQSVRDGHRDTVWVVDPPRGRSFATQLWVYDRSRVSCRRCGKRIARVRAGIGLRGTWFCAQCQSPIPV